MKYQIEVKEGAFTVGADGKRYLTMTRHEMTEALSAAVPVKDVEPLAVLADRKGLSSMDIIKVGTVFSIRIKFKTGGFKIFEDPTYEACARSARTYLEGLDDDKGGR